MPNVGHHTESSGNGQRMRFGSRGAVRLLYCHFLATTSRTDLPHQLGRCTRFRTEYITAIRVRAGSPEASRQAVKASMKAEASRLSCASFFIRSPPDRGQ